MRIGINEVHIYPRASGTRQREISTLPQLIRHAEGREWGVVVYLTRDLKDELIRDLVGTDTRVEVMQTPIPALPTWYRVARGWFYWPRRVRLDELSLFHTSYYPVPCLSVPTVLTVNDVRFVHLPGSYRPLRYLFLRLTVGISLRRASRIICISHDTRNDLVRYFGLSCDRIDVVHIPVAPRFRPVAQCTLLERARERYSLPDRFILFVGHLEPRKNLQRLVKAFEHLRNNGTVSHSLVILGRPSFAFQPLFETVKESQLGDHIVFTGYVADEDMPAVYSLADLLAFPSLHEGFGVPVIEAMACGTPVVTSNVSALPEVAGDAAVLVDPYSVAAIAHGISRVLKDRELHQDLVSKGFERVRRFSAQRAAEAICETYRKAVHD